jgi:hypothetical protein
MIFVEETKKFWGHSSAALPEEIQKKLKEIQQKEKIFIEKEQQIRQLEGQKKEKKKKKLDDFFFFTNNRNTFFFPLSK